MKRARQTRSAHGQKSKTHARIWAVVRRIPAGRVATYGQVATLAGFASQPRLAGYALHALPAHSAVPWHRVINAQGRISLPVADGRYALQQAMLEAEGIVFHGGRVDLARVAWNPRRRSTPAIRSRSTSSRRRRRP